MKEKVISGVALITIIVLAIASGFGFYQISIQQNQISELQTQNSELEEQNSELQNQLIGRENMIDSAHNVKITKFKWVGPYMNVVGVTVIQDFNVTITNTGNNTVSGLTLSVEVFSVETNAKFAEQTQQIDVIRAGQIVEISSHIVVGPVGGVTYSGTGVITLTLGDVLLGQWIRHLKGSF